VSPLRAQASEATQLVHIIHERFYSNRGFAAAIHWHATKACQRAGSPLSRSTSCFKDASLLRLSVF